MERKFNKSIKVFLLFCLSLSLFSTLFLTKPNTHVAAQEPSPTPEIEARIVGGDPAEIGEYPWQVALINSVAQDYTDDFYYEQFCGGSLIAPYWVLTAAHCVTENNGSISSIGSIDIVAGIYDLESPDPGYQRKDIAQIIRHPSYNRITLDNDIALIRLTSPVILGGSGETATALVGLATTTIGDLAGYSPSWVSGWGRVAVNPPAYDTELYEVDLPIISNQECSNSWNGIIAGNLCAGNGTGKDSCSGDSGGPLIIYQSGQAVQVGLVSSGASACGDYPGIYTRISYYKSWIDAYIPPARVNYVTRVDTSPNNSSSIIFNVNFFADVTGVDVSDFTLTTSGVSGASVTNVSGSGSSYLITVNTGSGDGEIRLDVNDNDTILSSYLMPLGGAGTGNGNFTTGEVYNIDKTAPTINSITCIGTNPCPSNMLNVSYVVTFSESVTGVDVTDFTLYTTGVAGATVSNVSGSGNTRVVSVNTGQGDGTIKLEFIDNDSVIDLAINPTSAGYTDGQTYDIDKPKLKAPILRSPRSGGAMNNTTPNFIWQRVAGAQSYNIQIDNNNDFSSPEHSINNFVGTNYNLATLSEGTHYWRVQANDVSGTAGKWSAVRTIIIDTTPPTAPTLVSPAGTLSTRTVIFRWQSSNGAVQYRLKIDNNIDLSTPEYTVTLRTLTRRMNLPAGTYYWCVEAKDALGNWSECTIGTQFEIILP